MTEHPSVAILRSAQSEIAETDPELAERITDYLDRRERREALGDLTAVKAAYEKAARAVHGEFAASFDRVTHYDPTGPEFYKRFFDASREGLRSDGPEFAPGDRVTVTGDDAKMLHRFQFGTLGSVVDYSGSSYLVEDDEGASFYVHARDLELHTAQEFEHGDRVFVVSDYTGEHRFEPGTVVSAPEFGDYLVEYDDGDRWWVPVDELQLYTPVQVGDRAKVTGRLSLNGVEGMVYLEPGAVGTVLSIIEAPRGRYTVAKLFVTEDDVFQWIDIPSLTRLRTWDRFEDIPNGVEVADSDGDWFIRDDDTHTTRTGWENEPFVADARYNITSVYSGTLYGPFTEVVR